MIIKLIIIHKKKKQKIIFEKKIKKLFLKLQKTISQPPHLKSNII